MLPDCWQIGRLDGQVEDRGEVGDCSSPKELQVDVGQTVRPLGSRVLSLFNGFDNESVGEGREGRVQLSLADLPGDSARETRCRVCGD